MDHRELKKAAEGDLQSIEQLCALTWKPLYRFVYFSVQNRQEAEEIVQEGYVRLLSHLKNGGRSPRSPLGFMKTVAANIVRDRWRQRCRRGPEVSLDRLEVEDREGLGHADTAAERLELTKALAALTEDQRTIVELRIVRGHSVAQTAALVGKSEGAVRTAQHRALRAMARMLKLEHQPEDTCGRTK